MRKVPALLPFVKSSTKTILSLCDHSGSWSAPYLSAGYNVIRVDPKNEHKEVDNLFVWRGTVADVLRNYKSLPPIHGILAAPPCTSFTKAGVRHWSSFDSSGQTNEHIQIVHDILDLVDKLGPDWWVIENPAGRIQKLTRIGKPYFYFDPCDFGDPWKKRTYLWGKFTAPLPLFVGSVLAVEPQGKSFVLHAPGTGAARQAYRSVTPPGFSSAFAFCNP